MHQGRSPAARSGEPVRHHGDDRIEIGASKRSIWPRAPRQRKESVLCADVAGGLRGDLLREHVERGIVGHDGVEITVTGGAEERGALDEVVQGDRQHPALGRAGNRVARSANTLQKRSDAMRGSDLADEIHVADVDAQLQGRSRDERLERSRFQTMLGVESAFLRQAAVVRGHRLVAEPVAQMPRDAFRQPPRVHEDERRPVLGDQRGQAVVVLLPHFVRHDRGQR